VRATYGGHNKVDGEAEELWYKYSFIRDGVGGDWSQSIIDNYLKVRR